MMKLSVPDTWPHSPLSRFHAPGHKPSREAVLKTLEQLNANAASVNSFTLGAPNSGLLGLTLSPAEYTATFGVPWNRPAQPANLPVFPAGAHGPQRDEIKAEHDFNWAQYNLMIECETALRNMVLEAADPTYWQELHQPLTGFGRRTLRELIDHMLLRYAPFNEAARKNVNQTMDIGWTGGPLEEPIARIEQGAAAYANVPGGALTDLNKCDKLYRIVDESGLLTEACRLWRFMAAANKTWDNCKAHFIQHADDRNDNETAGNAGYHQMANLVQELKDEVASANTQNLAMLARKQSDNDTTMAELRAELAATKAQLEVFRDLSNDRDTSSRNRNRNRGNRGPPKPPFVPTEWHLSKKHYCWTHGYNDKHDSPKCDEPDGGHVATATRSNPQKGKHHRG